MGLNMETRVRNVKSGSIHIVAHWDTALTRCLVPTGSMVPTDEGATCRECKQGWVGGLYNVEIEITDSISIFVP
jgi:hypothetical protein